MKRRKDSRAEDGPSKTRRKKESASLQALGEALIDLPPEALEELQLPDRLKEALNDARRIRKHEALRRQRQFVGRLMRDVDPAPIREFLQSRDTGLKEETRLFHAAETWRRRLIDGTEDTVAACVDSLGVDRRELEGVLSDLRRAPSQPLRKTASRRLFRLLHDALQAGQSRDRRDAPHVPPGSSR